MQIPMISCRCGVLWQTLSIFVLVGVLFNARVSAETGVDKIFNDGTSTNLPPGELYIGNGGANNTLLISNATVVSSEVGVIGNGVGANNNHGTITGSGSRWNITATYPPAGPPLLDSYYNFYVGRNASSNSLTISNGGRLDGGGVGGYGWIGYGTGDGNEMTVTGTGSVWSNMLVVSLGGTKSLLTVTDSAKVYSPYLELVGHDSTVVVDGTGAELRSSTYITLYGPTNALVRVQNGGDLYSYVTYLGRYTGGGQVLVTDPGSTWTNDVYLVIGEQAGVGNSVVVSNGATAYAASTTVGANTPAVSNNYLRATGAGSRFSTYGLIVGVYGISNSMFADSGGTVDLIDGGSGLIVGYSDFFGNSSNNLVRINGGNLLATNGASAVVNNVEVRIGKLEFNSGLINAERFLATNGVDSVVEYNGGTFITQGTTVNNGSAFTVGNGTSTANYQMNGGTHSFADDLVVAPQSFLSGVGTVVGDVTQEGSIAPAFANAAGQINVQGNVTQLLTSDLDIEIGGTTQGVTYDFLNIDGTALLAGDLNPSFLGAYQPSYTDVFTVLTADGGVNGAFANAPIDGRYLFNSGYFTVDYTANSVVLSEFLIPEPSTLLLFGLGSLVVWRVRKRTT